MVRVNQWLNIFKKMKKYYTQFKTLMLLTIFLAIVSALCYAQDTQNDSEEGFLEYSEPETPSTPDLVSTFLRMIASLLVILAFIALGIFAFKKLKYKESNNGGKPLSVLHKLPVGSKESICVVEVGDQILIIGVTNNYISLLSKVEDEDTIDKLRIKSTGNLSFSSSLMSYLKGKPLEGESEGT